MSRLKLRTVVDGIVLNSSLDVIGGARGNTCRQTPLEYVKLLGDLVTAFILSDSIGYIEGVHPEIVNRMAELLCDMEQGPLMVKVDHKEPPSVGWLLKEVGSQAVIRALSGLTDALEADGLDAPTWAAHMKREFDMYLGNDPTVRRKLKNPADYRFKRTFFIDESTDVKSRYRNVRPFLKCIAETSLFRTMERDLWDYVYKTAGITVEAFREFIRRNYFAHVLIAMNYERAVDTRALNANDASDFYMSDVLFGPTRQLMAEGQILQLQRQPTLDTEPEWCRETSDNWSRILKQSEDTLGAFQAVFLIDALPDVLKDFAEALDKSDKSKKQRIEAFLGVIARKRKKRVYRDAREVWALFRYDPLANASLLERMGKDVHRIEKLNNIRLQDWRISWKALSAPLGDVFKAAPLILSIGAHSFCPRGSWAFRMAHGRSRQSARRLARLLSGCFPSIVGGREGVLEKHFEQLMANEAWTWHEAWRHTQDK